jgi:hypothetical protein
MSCRVKILFSVQHIQRAYSYQSQSGLSDVTRATGAGNSCARIPFAWREIATRVRPARLAMSAMLTG